MTSIGIDIGNYSIKIAEVIASGKGYTLKRFEIFKLSVDPKKDQEIEVLDALRTFATQYDPSSTKFVLGINQKQVSVRRLTFPFKERHKILKSLPFELEDDIPFSNTDAVFEAKLIRYFGNKADVIAIACPKEIIRSRIQLSEDCLFSLDLLSVKSIATANIFEAWSEAPPQVEVKDIAEVVTSPTDVVLDIGYKSTNLLIMKDNGLLEVRTFDWGGYNIISALAKKSSSHLTEAAKNFEQKSFVLLNHEGSTEEQITFSNVVKKEIDNFAQQLNLTLLEIKSHYRVNFVKGLITGGVSQVKNLSPYFTQKTEIPFKRFNVFTWNPATDTKVDEAQGYSASVAIGLAIEGLRKPKNPPVNLRKLEFAQQSQSFQLFVKKWSYTLGVATAALVFFIVYGLLREDFAEKMASKSDEVLRQQAVEIVPDIKKVSRASKRNIKQYIKEQERLMKMQKTAESLRRINSSLDVLSEISKNVPDGKVAKMNVKKLKISNQFVEIAGEVNNKSVIQQIINSLKNISIKGKVVPEKTDIKAQPGWSPFAVSFSIDRMSGGEE